MRKVLGEETTAVQLPVTESFQDLGFSSLLLGKLTTHLRRASQQPGLAATAVFLHPTVRKLAAHLDEAKQTNSESSGRQPYTLAFSNMLYSWTCVSECDHRVLFLACVLHPLPIVFPDYNFRDACGCWSHFAPG
jgi:hypothetical protein